MKRLINDFKTIAMNIGSLALVNDVILKDGFIILSAISNTMLSAAK